MAIDDLDTAVDGLARCTPRLDVRIETLPLSAPFRISDHVFHDLDVAVVRLEADGHVGIGEAAGVFYRGDDPAGIVRTIENLREQIEAGLDHRTLQTLLPAGGARNALDCALWDLQARRLGQPVWALLGVARPKPLLTAHTISNGAPSEMAAMAARLGEARILKLKLNGDGGDAERIRAVRLARNDAWLGVDANRSLTPETLDRLVPVLTEADARLIEQPFAAGADDALAGISLAIPVAADESVQDMADLERLAGLYQAVNIKLDKCGGLTEALRMARRARDLGLDAMVGNMLGSSLAMAPACLVGQYCRYVDLDGPLFLAKDRTPAATYRDGYVVCPDALWGGGMPQ